jgi:hypothetical protein
MLTSLNLGRSPIGDKIPFIEDSKTVSDAPSAVHVVRDDYDRGLMLGFLTEEKFVDFRSSNTIETTARFVSKKDLRLEHKCASKSGPLTHST